MTAAFLSCASPACPCSHVLHDYRVSHEVVPGLGALGILAWNGLRYLVGVQIAELIGRRVSNIYRAIERRSGASAIRRASKDEVVFLLSQRAAHITRSTVYVLVHYDAAVDFLKHCVGRIVSLVNGHTIYAYNDERAMIYEHEVTAPLKQMREKARREKKQLKRQKTLRNWLGEEDDETSLDEEQ